MTLTFEIPIWCIRSLTIIGGITVAIVTTTFCLYYLGRLFSWMNGRK